VQGQPAITVLVIMNLALQLFDGAATYVGWERFGEANPILRAGFESWGVGPTLLAAKLLASTVLIWIAYVPHRIVAAVALAFTLGTYTAFSFIPWSVRFLT